MDLTMFTEICWQLRKLKIYITRRHIESGLAQYGLNISDQFLSIVKSMFEQLEPRNGITKMISLRTKRSEGL